MANRGDGGPVQYIKIAGAASEFVAVLGSAIVAEYAAVILLRHLSAA